MDLLLIVAAKTINQHFFSLPYLSFCTVIFEIKKDIIVLVHEKMIKCYTSPTF